jgi:hypothetical protein
LTADIPEDRLRYKLKPTDNLSGFNLHLIETMRLMVLAQTICPAGGSLG